ncbi:MAG: hypothetical protein ACT4P6_09075 [Gemmatimonadaceae bacterium]
MNSRLWQVATGILYVPQSYRPERPAPFVLLLHGAGGGARNWFGAYGVTSRAIVPLLRSRGYAVEYVELAGGHEVPAAVATQGLSWFSKT